jgi:hypothetical protein
MASAAARSSPTACGSSVGRKHIVMGSPCASTSGAALIAVTPVRSRNAVWDALSPSAVRAPTLATIARVIIGPPARGR